MGLDLINKLSYECFYFNKIRSCKIALNEIALYKSSGFIRENYSCNTRLLGLEAKLLMSLIELNKRKYLVGNFNDIKRICTRPFYLK